jgi:hypothetical protein
MRPSDAAWRLGLPPVTGKNFPLGYRRQDRDILRLGKQASQPMERQARDRGLGLVSIARPSGNAFPQHFERNRYTVIGSRLFVRELSH